MYATFMICAILGGTIFVIQFLIALIGFGAEGMDLDDVGDIPDDLPDDIPDDVPDDISDSHGHLVGHGSTWLFSVISLRTVIAALTFFGIAGLAALSSGQSQGVAFGIALLFGLAALYGVHFLMKSLHQLRHDGTIRIERSVGERGSVYVPIPPNNSGTGQVQLKVQGRLVEYTATTPNPERLATGTQVVVVNVISPTTVEVEPILGKVSSEPVRAVDA
jgi:membrane protein implicated in regulation of membrane protease activity